MAIKAKQQITIIDVENDSFFYDGFYSKGKKNWSGSLDKTSNIENAVIISSVDSTYGGNIIKTHKTFMCSVEPIAINLNGIYKTEIRIKADSNLLSAGFAFYNENKELIPNSYISYIQDENGLAIKVDDQTVFINDKTGNVPVYENYIIKNQETIPVNWTIFSKEIKFDSYIKYVKPIIKIDNITNDITKYCYIDFFLFEDITNEKLEISSIFADGTITPIEKKTLKNNQKEIVEEYRKITKSCELYNVKHEDYTNSYNLLSNLFKEVLSNMNEIYIDKDNALVTAIATYYTEKEKILYAITDSQKKDFATVSGNITDVEKALNDFEDVVHGSFKDNVIDESEAKALQQSINTLLNEKADIDNDYESLIKNTYLSTKKREEFILAKTNYDSANTSLISFINNAIADNKISEEEKLSVDSAFNTYRDNLGKYRLKSQEVKEDIDNNKLNNAIDGIYFGANNFILHSDFSKKENSYSSDGTIEITNNQAIIKNASQFKMDLSEPFGTLKRGDDIALSSIATLTSKSGAVGLNKFIGGNINVYSEDHSYITNSVKKLKINMITVPAVVQITNATSNDPTIPDWGLNRTKAYLDNLKAAGAITENTRLIFEPHPIINDGSTSETEFNPSDKTVFFAKWKAEIIKALNFLNEYKFFGIYIGTNFAMFDTGTDNISHWEKLANDLRSLYNNHKLIYRTNYWVTASWDEGLKAAYTAKLNNPLWDKVDIIAIAAYFELNDKAVPTVDELYKDITEGTSYYNRGQNIYQEVKAFHDKWNKPIMFGELGCPSKEYGAKTPWDNLTSNVDNQTVQANFFEAYNKAFIYKNDTYPNDWFLGYSIFTLGTVASEYNIVDKEAQSIINKGIDFINNNAAGYINCQINNKDTNTTIVSFDMPLSASLESIKEISTKLVYDASIKSELIFNMPSNTTFTLTKPMLANGTKATSWVPSSEDTKQNIKEVENALNDFQNTVTGSFKDGVIDEAEAKSLQQNINTLLNEKADIDKDYLVLYNNSLLSNDIKNNLKTAKTNYDLANDSTISFINNAIADNKISDAEKQSVDSAFNNYRSKLGLYREKSQEAKENIDSNRLNNLQIGVTNLLDNSKFDKNFNLWVENGGTNSIVEKDGYKCAKLEHTAFGYTRAVSQSILNKIVSGVTYTVSGWIKTENIIFGSNSPTCMFYIDGNYLKDGVSTWYGLGSKQFPLNNGWQFVTYTFVANSNYIPTAQTCNLFIHTRDLTGQIYFHRLKLEKGSKATDWSQSPADLDKAIDLVNEKSQEALDDLSDIANDNKLTPNEKHTSAKEWNTIDAQYQRICEELARFGLSSTDITDKHHALRDYLSPLFSNMSTTSNIVGTDFRNKFKDYYNSQQVALNSISSKSKELADNANDKYDNMELGGPNLLLNSNLKLTTSDYLMARVKLGNDKPKHGETVTFTLKGTLGGTKIGFAIYNSGGTIRITELQPDKIVKDNIYQITVPWRIDGAVNEHIEIYSMWSQHSGASTIEWIKLERGNKASLSWSAAPEDIQSEIDDKTSHTNIFNSLTDNGRIQGIFMQNNQLYINGEYIKANSIDVNKLKANSINTDKLQANSISADKLQTNSVIASKIAAGAITADKLIVGAGDVSYGNLATGKAISGTSLSNQNVVNDGNKNIGSTYCGFGSGNSSNNSDERDYVQIDLGKVYRVSESKIYFYAGDTRSYWYKIKYSADGTNWYYAIGNSSNTGWAQSSLPITTSGINPTHDTFSIPIAARYIRLYANGSTANGGNHIYEWELFSKSSSQIDGAIITTGILNASLVNITNMNASNINTGNLVVGGTNNRDGAIIVKNSSNAEMARMDKNGVVVNNTGYFIKDEYGILNNVNRPANKIVDAKFQMGLKFDHDGIVGNDTFFDNKDYYIKSLQNVEYWDYVKIDEIRYANGHFNSGYPGAALRKTPEIVSLIASTKAEPYQEWSKIGDTAYISKVDTCLGSIIDATNKNNEFTFSTYAAGVKTKDLTYSGPWTLRVRVVPQVVQQPMGGVYKTVWDTASTITRDITISSYSEMRRFATTFNKSHFSSINGDGLTGKFFVCFGSPHATNRIVMNGFQIVDGSKASLLDNGVDNTFINGKQIYGSLKVEHVQMGDPSLNQVNPGMTCYGNSAFHNHMYIENNSTINITGTGQINSPAFNLNGYKNWDTGNFSGTGGGAAIVNDNGSYKALMILGNSTAGGVRLVRVWDELRVEGKKFQVSGNMTMGEMGNDMDSIKTEKSILFTTAKYKNVMVANAFFDGANDVHIDKANGASQIVLEKNSWPKFRWSNAGSGTNGIAQWGAYYNMLTDSPSQGVAMQRGDAYRPNFNDYTYSGIWQVNMDGGNTNGPNTYPYGLLAVFASNGTIGQLYFPHSGSHPLHYRCKWSTGIWTNWANVGWSA